MTNTGQPGEYLTSLVLSDAFFSTLANRVMRSWWGRTACGTLDISRSQLCFSEHTMHITEAKNWLPPLLQEQSPQRESAMLLVSE